MEADFSHLLSWWKKRRTPALPGHPYQVLTQSQHITWRHILEISNTVFNVRSQSNDILTYAKYNTNIFLLQHQSTNKSVVQKVGAQLYISDSTVNWTQYQAVYIHECKMSSGKRTVCTVKCAVLSHCTGYCCYNSTFRPQQRQTHRWTLATHWHHVTTGASN